MNMDLIEITTMKENNLIKEFIKNYNQSAVSSFYGQWWIGATDLGSEGVFYWAGSGDEIEFEDFGSNNNPDNFNKNEHCVEMWHFFQYRWNDRACDDRSYFICRRNSSCSDYFDTKSELNTF